MRALLIYESLYGNTAIVANCIAEGLRERHEMDPSSPERHPAGSAGEK